MNWVTNEFTYAATLNNIGCKLLEHGAFREAFETFGDALDSYRETFLRMDGSNHQARMDMAASRVRHVNLMRSSIISILELGDDDFASLACETVFGKFMMKGFRLFRGGASTRYTDVDCAVILYNYGLAHIMILQFGMRERKAFKDASRFMRIALSLFTKELKTRLRRGLAENSKDFRDLSCISKVVATNYSYIIARRGRYAEARQCYHEVEEFLDQNPHHAKEAETTAAAA